MASGDGTQRDDKIETAVRLGAAMRTALPAMELWQMDVQGGPRDWTRA